MKRRDILKGIGAIIGVGVVGKVTATQAAPVELPVVQAPQVPYWMGLGSITVTGPVKGFTIMGTGDPYAWIDYQELQRQYAFGQSQLYNGRHIAPVLGGFDDDGGEG